MQKPVIHDVSKLGSEMLQFTSSVGKLDTPGEVLDSLHNVTVGACQLNVLGAAMFPIRWGDWGSIEKGKTVFLHKSAPEGWWEDHIELNRIHPGPAFMLAQLSLAPFTMSELMRMVEPLGIDRWPIDLALKYGMRDRLNCPVGGPLGGQLLVAKRAVAACRKRSARSFSWEQLSVPFACRILLDLRFARSVGAPH